MILKQFNKLDVNQDECDNSEYYFSSCRASGGKIVSARINIFRDCISVSLNVFDKNSNIILLSYNKIKGNSIKDACSSVFGMNIEEYGGLDAIKQFFDRIATESYVIFYRTGSVLFGPVKKERLNVIQAEIK